ncbi:mannose-6-phosphate isomerase, class I [Corynebacterium gerontici]|uniref:mannose-6-phosphate isomerase n=1 Tax=Corynebacterium gerontici TaxID=2079234 RepID=A0A3G6J458_9CORY|nr:mannose-6-phosphate isomerase, class I [Corynebacterium gerontici]AZA10864.1 Mannose-6-phosphate isomerase [Corynebacterium gerontici]
MQKLIPSAQAYSWGSRTLIQQLRGEQPSNTPLAELWYGAHPAAPSSVDGEALTEVIAKNPVRELGGSVVEQYSERLPFLLKLLAAEQPLSLQAHPSLEQAREGFARENDEGIALDARERNYRDDNHKPELMVAITEFHAMAGFRPLERTRALFRALDCPELEHYANLIPEHLEGTKGAEEGDLRALFTTWITIPSTARTTLIEAVVAAAKRVQESVEPWMQQVLRQVIDLQDRHPGDIGVLGALLLNHIALQPGEAIYLDAGNLHAYVSGLGVEIMANSDNVLRGGLTPKYVDIPELVHVLRFSTLEDPVVQPQNGVYQVPAREFSLRTLDVQGEVRVEHAGPAIVLCTEGSIHAGVETLNPTEALWISADDPAIEVHGEGKLFIASVGAV